MRSFFAGAAKTGRIRKNDARAGSFPCPRVFGEQLLTEKKQFKYKLAVFAVQNKKTACSKAFLPNLRKPHGDSNLCKEFLGKNIKFSSIHYDNGAEFLRKTY